MRVGDFGVEVVAHERGRVRELESGHVLARPGQVYRLRLRNHGPLRCVADVEIDGRCVTAGGLVLEPWSATELERPVDGEDGRFTVVAEGNEAVFGPDGGRDNPALGLVEARFRRELPRAEQPRAFPNLLGAPTLPIPGAPPTRPLPAGPGRRPMAPPEWFPPMNGMPDGEPHVQAQAAGFETTLPMPESRPIRHADVSIERAAGTGLTGRSDQEFVPVHVGPLETEATVIQLRLVIGTEEPIGEETARPLGARRAAPPRPAARP